MRYQGNSSTFKENARARRIESVRERLLFPRLQVSLILVLTALAGFLTSIFLRSQGVLKMWFRYPVAIVIAYGVFLALLALWVWLQRNSGEVDLDLDVLEDLPSGHEHSYDGGDDYGATETDGSWGTNLSASPDTVNDGTTSSLGFFDLDLEEGFLVVLAIAAIVLGLIASFYVIYIAPALLAEILVDGVLVASLYKRVKGIEQRHWLRAAVRRTILPALLVVAFFTVAGYLLHQAVPEAHTIGEVWTHVRNR